MPHENAIQGTVIRIPSDTSVIIDVGSKHGVRLGMDFKIYAEGEPIYTPDRTEELGKIEHVKAVVRVTQVQENFSVATSIEEFDITDMSKAIYTALSSTKKPLPVSERDIEPFSSFEKTIKVGDLAKQLKQAE